MFGCDICQQVCPWNERFAQPTHEPAFQAAPAFDRADAIHYLALDEAEFEARFQNSPLKRTKRAGLVRNASVVAGNQRLKPAVEQLVLLLRQDQDPVVRGHAAWALGQIGSGRARAGLQQALAAEESEAVLAEVRAALQSLGR